MTTFSVASTTHHDSRAAGLAVAQSALAACPRPNLALLFCTAQHDPHKLHAAVRETLGPQCLIVGGSAVGVITHEALSYDGDEVGLALMQSDSARIDAFIETGLPQNEFAVGQKLGQDLKPSLASDSSLLLFYDSINHLTGQPLLNMGTPLLKGIEAAIKSWPAQGSVAGMGVLGDMQLHPSHQFFDANVAQQSAIGIPIGGSLRMDTIIMHGCRPAGRYHTITKTDNQVILEIDNRPALDVIAEMLGPEAGLSWDDYAFFVTLGLNKGDPYGPFREEDYANRMCIAVDKARKGLVMFENDLAPGMRVQLMRRSIDFDYVGQRTRELLARIGPRKPLFAFYIDCAGRAAQYCGMDEEEAVEVQKALPKSIPLLGVYSGVEIARVGKDIQALDWTGVLCLFSE
jgi:hypothetical protein